ncbi:hypothetical protein PAHAL_3G272400 [Panicum hallii]|uniref:Uncharacterized protein n=1 Tax=Panicum hallii TaxID=206008 RepID=A0A2T8KJN3_9POAL|nr:hypothetical protein PAHAL_3G272400 [Panicum hallii]
MPHLRHGPSRISFHLRWETLHCSSSPKSPGLQVQGIEVDEAPENSLLHGSSSAKGGALPLIRSSAARPSRGAMSSFAGQRSRPWVGMAGAGAASEPAGDSVARDDAAAASSMRGAGGAADAPTNASAISFGFAATAVLVSMFLLMAIFEHLIKPGLASSSSSSSPRTDDDGGEGRGRGRLPPPACTTTATRRRTSSVTRPRWTTTPWRRRRT